MLCERSLRSFEVRSHRRQFLRGDVPAFLGLVNIGQRLGVLRIQFAQAFFVEMNPAFVPINLAFELQARVAAGRRFDVPARKAARAVA